MRYISKINRGRNGKKSIFDVAQAAMNRDSSDVLQRTGSEARCCKIQVRIFQFKPIHLHKSKFSPSEIFIWLESYFMISENELLKTACWPNGEQVLWERRELRTEELQNIHCSPNITMFLNCGCIRRSRNFAGFEEIKMHEKSNLKKCRDVIFR